MPARASIPDAERPIFHHINQLLGEYGYGLVCVVIMLEAMGLPLPGESMLIASAIYCATTHKLPIEGVLAAAALGAIMGDNAGYLIGRSLGYRLLARYGRRVGISEDRLLLGRYLFRRFGGSVVFVGRFVAILRTFVALLAGANRMRWGRFLFWNALGGCAWVGGYGTAAYLIGTEIQRIAGPVALALAAIVATAAAVLFLFLKRNEQRLTLEARKQAGVH